MRAFSCSRCGALVNFDDGSCLTCGSTLGYIEGVDRMRALEENGTVTWDRALYVPCANAELSCNWLVESSTGEIHCPACRLIRKRPHPADEVATDQLAKAMHAERRLFAQLRENGLPLVSYEDRAGGIAFDLLSSTTGPNVTIGHANGVVTIDLSEVGDAYRVRLREKLGEPYRTMLGHFRHEIGHYYWQELVFSDDVLLDDCRRLFGDDRTDYRAELERHYKEGAPDDWSESFISEYATMHPWEDFAETWAHYLHITGTMQTAAAFSMQLGGLVGDKLDPILQGSLRSAPGYSATAYRDSDIDSILDAWHPLARAFNQINRSMGKADLYPFVIAVPVREKLAFVHEVVRRAGREQ
ncbi:hypothetical protein GCM10025865_16140 [Paraoerskovia sediminicola]|uniref:Zinc-ribbon domain-containing protein n=1 Tax=Paraoerskovia sediminicola TaxID=1138587 RepID=A0ABN6XEU4_9CELL|nr:putative zinc-binding metallopeptidase [Paraoerskovia sediminicola]BDZ42315.1 hypothetical protein GCM10025865_16140 [Paraoerskovia sediminicola]